ncbi:MAG: HNH endonuclease [Solirubrobacteraceae bacterium]
MCHTGGAARVLKRYAAIWGIPTDHFTHAPAGIRDPIPLESILVRGSTYSRSHLKARLLAAGLKQMRCELCGQGPEWRGRPMGLVLDHVNGVRDDNRLENLRMLCPNCNATLETHCGRQLLRRAERRCEHCGEAYRPSKRGQRFCSRRCGVRHNAPDLRRAGRPPYEQLIREFEATSYLAVGRRYGVSDNAIRKWVAAYRREAAAARGEALASAA